MRNESRRSSERLKKEGEVKQRTSTEENQDDGDESERKANETFACHRRIISKYELVFSGTAHGG